MKKYTQQFELKRQEASGLLLTFFLGSILISLVLSVSFLVLRDVRSVRALVTGVQTQYAAEGMNELGLQLVNENLPGYEPSIEDHLFSIPVLASLSVTAREATVPCSVRDEEWRALAPNESVQLALFAQVDDKSNTEKIEKFNVEFFVADEEGEVSFAPSNDVLRWKILGLDSSGQTEAISEFIPLLSGRTTSENPSIFGSWIEDVTVPSGYSSAKFRQDGSPAVFHPDYPIETFLEGHDYSYLVLTNAVTRTSENVIYFRLNADHLENTVDAVCEYITIQTDARGANGALYSQQSIETVVREGENLPAFDFVFYNTDNTEEESGGSSELGIPTITLPEGLDLGEVTVVPLGE